MNLGTLVVVGTPIGNLGDLSPRAVEALKGADVIFCEDTRHSRKLLTASGISGVPLVSLHQHNEGGRSREVLSRLDRGERVALVTDAGMPGIADPGHRAIELAANAGHVIEVVPGPSAAITALVASGLDAERFVFEGFLPRKGRERDERLAAIAAEQRTTVVYEAPNRVARTIADLATVCGPLRRLAVARELTKLHEEVWRGTLGAGAEHWAAVEARGEFVLVIGGGGPAPEASDEDIVAALTRARAAGASTKDATAAVAAALGVAKKRVYALAVGPSLPTEVTTSDG